ncbi:unnamed protein product [Choristocarpus tenellus]
MLCESRANVHLTPDREDLVSTRPTKRTDTFGNNGKLKAKETGDMVLMVTVKNSKPTRVVLKDVLWVPGLPCRILSTGTIRRNGRGCMGLGTKESYLKTSKNSSKISVRKFGGFLNLTGTIINEE